MPETQNYGFEHETPQSKPGITLTGDIDGSAPILAEQVDSVLASIDARLSETEGDVSALQALTATDSGWQVPAVTAASGFELNSAAYRRWGPIVTLRIALTRTGADIDATSAGNVLGDPLIATIDTVDIRPDTIRREVLMLCTVTSGAGYVDTDGTIQLADLHTNSTLRTDDIIRFSDTYFTSTFS